MKIGIPQSLLYAYYYPFWKTYFEELGLEVVLTPATTKSIIDKGIKASVPEICVPIKVYLGHVITLLEQEVDWIFVPRFVSIKKGQFFCPKFMGLPDMIRHSMEGIEEKLIMPYIDTRSDNIAESFKKNIFGTKLSLNHRQNKNALAKAEAVWLRFREYCRKGYSATEAAAIVLNQADEEKYKTLNEGKVDVTIGLLGYVYNIYDPFISMDILNKLRAMGVKVKTFEMLEEKDMNRQLECMPKTLFWTFSDKLLAAGYHFYHDEECDGMIHVTAFGCGPDSLLGKLLELDSSIYKKPFMTVRVDEHSGENHLQTRIEAFVDMIKRKKINVQRGA
ncbi:Predicted nucleotide-binding protein, sugar kinase/HSP70/actin superfamily [Natronincola peptidivorans]|uniref:Predicted nucleotide-binding protein, sugar kinase/HSP70/actin superfamily n=1 Tax=Natronincola peptidivorans TaxID=426128 RepID=A0A1I0GBB4_9FIRM|nr:acyl-CoA dehydratase activase-related protein [Natronincola peptidivorans]SET68029.1 Predicted nucleotide-binding protein, sugar kinase/HSP70/actin superfamily [Natronincola peptidivorans]